MPFTFSHPAIILALPFLNRKWFSLTGLVIGSMTPDFEYFLRMKMQSDYSHTIGGIFWFDLPLGLILAFVFHNVVRDCLFDNLPTNLKSRLSTFKQFKWNEYFEKNYIVVIISILIGTASHLFWDSFTHHHGFFVETIPALENTVGIFNLQIPYWKILQHLSSLVGGIIIAFAIFQLPKNKNIIRQSNLKYWSILIGLILAVIGLRFLNGLDYKLYGHVIVTAISASLISLVMTPIIIKKK